MRPEILASNAVQQIHPQYLTCASWTSWISSPSCASCPSDPSCASGPSCPSCPSCVCCQNLDDKHKPGVHYFIDNGETGDSSGKPSLSEESEEDPDEDEEDEEDDDSLSPFMVPQVSEVTEGAVFVRQSPSQDIGSPPTPTQA